MLRSLIAISLIGCLPSTCFGQEVLGDPRLEVKGAKGQAVVISVRYFDGKDAVETVTSRVEIASNTEPEQLAFGHTGLHVVAVAAIGEPVRVTLLDADKAVSSAVSDSSGMVELKQGSVPSDDILEPPRTHLDGAEQRLINLFLEAVRQADTRAIVSNIPLTNIDWQTLDAYCQALRGELGEPSMQPEDFKRWIGWEGSLGARVLSGSMDFELGECRFKLMVVDGKLVDVEANCRSMPIDWFNKQPEIEDYVAQSHALVRAIFAGDAAKAHRLFARRYHEEVTVASLVELSQDLRKQFGSEVVALELKRSNFEALPPPSTSRRLSLDSVLVLDTGKRCISRVEFLFPSGKDKIGRAQLASIKVSETWQSASPSLAEKLTRALRLIGRESSDDTQAKFSDLFHPDVRSAFDTQKLTAFLNQVSAELGPMEKAPDFDLWAASTGVKATTIGPASFGKAENATVQACFADGELFGLTLLTKNYAASTLDQISGFSRVEQKGRDFWKALFEGSLNEAYGMLGADFRGQMPIDEFRRLISESGLGDGLRLKAVRADAIRISDRDDRPFPMMLAAYFVGEFEDGSLQALSCEFRKMESAADRFEIMNFTNDDQAVFPVADAQVVTHFFEAFLQGDAKAVINLVDADTRQLIDPGILQAFLDQLAEVSGGAATPPPTSSLLREYAVGKQFLRLSSTIVPGQIPVEATFEFDQLRTFYFRHPDMISFVDKIQDTSGLEAQVADFVKTWLAGELSETSKYLVASLRNASVEQRLTTVRNDFAVSLGDWIGSQTIVITPVAATNQIRMDIELEFRNGKRMLQLTYDINAYNGLISAVHFP